MKGIAITTAAAACCLAVTTANKLPLPSSSTFGIGRTTTFARGGAVGKSTVDFCCVLYYSCCNLFVCCNDLGEDV